MYDSLFRQFGVYRADSIEEFFDIARSCVVGTLPANERVAMVTVSGGVGVLMADDANRRGLEVAPVPEAAQRRMLELVPFAAARNPIDVTGQVLNDPTLLDRAIELATGHGDDGSVASFRGSIGRNPALMEATRGAWIERKAATPEMHFAVAGFCTPDYTRDLPGRAILESCGRTSSSSVEASSSRASHTTRLAGNSSRWSKTAGAGPLAHESGPAHRLHRRVHDRAVGLGPGGRYRPGRVRR